MNTEAIYALIREGENSHVEFKAEAVSNEELAITIVLHELPRILEQDPQFVLFIEGIINEKFPQVKNDEVIPRNLRGY